MSMTRSKTQVMLNFLPGQVFEHADGFIARTAWLRERLAEVNHDLLLENLADQLEHWRDGDTSRAPGYPDPVKHADKYVVLEPDGELYYDIWPLVLACMRPSCGRVVEFRGPEQWRRARQPGTCDRCGSRRAQLEFIMVHNCGRMAAIDLPSCERHQRDHIYLEDTGSFETSQWRCRAPGCNGRSIGGMRAHGCPCGEGGRFVSRTVRQNSRFLTQTFPFVTFEEGALARLRGAPSSDKVVIGSYLGLFDDYESALAEAGGKGRGNAETWAIMEQALRQAGQNEEQIAEARRDYLGEASAAFQELSELVSDDVVASVGVGQRARERTLIFAGTGRLRLWRLNELRDEALANGRQTAAERVSASIRRINEFGFSDCFVVENFPVALVSYGATRLSSNPKEVLLTRFPSVRRYGDTVPVYATTSRTEAIFFELDAMRVAKWLRDNDHPVETTETATRAKAVVLTAYHLDAGTRELIDTLQHTLAHALIRNLGELAGFSEGTMAEYLIPSLLTFGIYANVHQQFSLGALVSLLEHRLDAWLDATRQGAETCAWDPLCGDHEGACASCLHIAFGCSNRNEGLDRAVLFGSPAGHDPCIRTGFWT